MTTAFIIGNGKSRQHLDLNKLKPHGKIYACNAVYRTFEPDYLVAVDTKMVSEIDRHKWQHTHEVWTNPNKVFDKMNKLNFFEESLGWSSGPTALWLATYGKGHDNDPIYILGFDFEGSGGLLNNIYADTENYKKSSDPATYHGNWARQTAIVIQKNPQKRYIRVVVNLEDYCPDNLQQLVNLEHITIHDFKNRLQIL